MAKRRAETFGRFLALSMALWLALPNSSSALRPPEKAEASGLEELEHLLRSEGGLEATAETQSLEAQRAQLEEDAKALWNQILAILEADPQRAVVVLANKTDGYLVAQKILPRLEEAQVRIETPYVQSTNYHENTAGLEPNTLSEDMWRKFVTTQPHLIFVDGKEGKSEHQKSPDSFWWAQNVSDLFEWWRQAPTPDLAWNLLPRRSWFGELEVSQIQEGPYLGRWKLEGLARLTARPVSLSFHADQVETLIGLWDRFQPDKGVVQPYRLVATEAGLLRRQEAGDYRPVEGGWPLLQLEQLPTAPHIILHRTGRFFEQARTIGDLTFDVREIPRMSGLEEGWVEEAAAKVDEYMAQSDIAGVVPLLWGADDPQWLTESFPALRETLEGEGIPAVEHVVRIPPAFFRSGALLPHALKVYLDREAEWAGAVRDRLEEAVDSEGRQLIQVVTDPGSAEIVVGERDVRSDKGRQILVRVQPDSARRVVTPALFAGLEQSGLLTPGAVIDLYQGDPDKDAYLFA